MDLREYKNKRICVAISGGVDSTALLHYMKNAQNTYGFILSAVHCQHSIRGEESLADMWFVENVCKAWDVPLSVYHENCPLKAEREKCSLETAARNFRLSVFEELVSSGKADYIATAHHALDGAETVLFRIARGCSLTGAKGIAERSGYLLRPFLHWTKGEIYDYAQQNGLSYCIDQTNLQTDATRNKLRLQVFPLLEEAVPGATGNLLRFAHLAAQDDEYLYTLSEKLVTKTGTDSNRRATVTFSDEQPLFCRACLTAMKFLGIEYDYTQAHLESLFHLQKAERGSLLHLPQGVIATRGQDSIVFAPRTAQIEYPAPMGAGQPFDKKGFDGGRYAVNVYTAPPDTADGVLRADGDKFPKTAVYRFRKDGDRIEKFGGGTKTLKKFFNEKKVPPKLREYIPLIAEKDGKEVYVVCGMEISEKVKVDEHTENVIYIQIKENAL